MLPTTSKTAGRQLINNAQNLIKNKAMIIQRMQQQQQLMGQQALQLGLWQKGLEEVKTSCVELDAKKQFDQNDSQNNSITFSNTLNQHLMQQTSQYQYLSEKVNIQQIVREINEKGLTAKERSADFFLDSLFKKKNSDSEPKETSGEVIDSDPNDMEFRRGGDEGDSEEMLFDWQQDKSDVEFEDSWGVERRGEQRASTDNENDDSDEDGGEMMPVLF